MIGLVNTEKRRSLSICVCGVDGKAHAFGCDRPEFEAAFCQTFQISYRIRNAFIFNKNEGNNQKAENKLSGRVGVGRALFSQ